MIRKRIEELEEYREIRKEGKVNCLPFEDSFPKLSSYLPGIMKGVIYGVTANSGVGKSKFTKYAFVKCAYDYCLKHPEAKTSVKILYFALEESKEEFIDSMISLRLAEKYKVHLHPLYLQSMYAQALSPEVLQMIKDEEPYLQGLMDCVDVIDNVYNPTGIYKYCRTVSNELGSHSFTKKTFTKKNSFGQMVSETVDVYDKYTPNDDSQYVMVIVDHLNLLEEERGAESQHKSIRRWVTDYARKQIAKNWNWVVVNVIQQAAESEKKEFHMGRTIASKVEPSLDGLGNNKEIARDHHVIMGLFAPERYNIEHYQGYDIRRMTDHYRSLIFLKNRIGVSSRRLNTLFVGASGVFKELPASGEKDAIEGVYNIVEQLQKKQNEKFQIRVPGR